MKKFVLSCIFTGVAFATATSQAREMTREDAGAVLEMSNTNISVKKDGSSVLNREVLIEIKREDARRMFSPLTLSYSAISEIVEVLEAKMLHGTESSSVPKEKIQDKNVNGSDSQLHQITIPFPNLESGAKVYLKFRVHTLKPSYPGFYSTKRAFAGEFNGFAFMFSVRETLRVESELPLYLNVHDPDGLLSVKSGGVDSTINSLYVETTRPYQKGFVDEVLPAYDLKVVSQVTLSSLPKGAWNEFGAINVSQIEQILSEPLPDVYEMIANQAELEPTLEEKIDRVTDLLIHRITYLLNQSSRDEQLIPRPLSQVAKLGQGDCKDFAAAAISIFRRLGITAHFATVTRGEKYYDSVDEDYPGHFGNHAIVRVEKGGRVLWIDPTNRVSFANGIFSDIADRNALVYQEGNSRLERIPGVNPQEARVEVERLLTLRENSSSSIVKIGLFGAEAISFTGLERILGKDRIPQRLAAFISDDEIVIKGFRNFDLNSKIVKDLEFTLSLDSSNPYLPTSFGEGYLLSVANKSPLSAGITKTRVSGLKLTDAPYSSRRRIKIVKSNSRKLLPIKNAVKCSGESEWASYSRTIHENESEVFFEHAVTYFKKSIPVEALLTEAFESFRKGFMECNKPFVVICDDIQCSMGPVVGSVPPSQELKADLATAQ